MVDRGVKRIGGASLARRAREEILGSILDGQFPAGRLPPEDELAQRLGVSRTTVRTALQSLEKDGFVTRRPRVGTSVNTNVAPHRLGLHRLVGFSTLLSEQGHVPSVEIGVREEARLSEDRAARLRRPAETPSLILDKLFRADGRPAIAVVDTIPMDSLRRRPAPAEMPDAIFELFESSGRETIDHAVVEIVPRTASRATAERLELRRGEACLLLLETHFTRENAPIAISEILVNDRFVRFDVVRRAD